jgi:hypothetical protein
VVGEEVMSLGDADLAEAAVAAFAGEEEGGDAGGVGLKGEEQIRSR